MERMCVKCKHVKPMEEFRKLQGDGFSSYCERCRSHARNSMRKIPAEERTKKHKAWRENNAEHKYYRDRNNLRYNTGLTPEQFQELVERQNGLCAVCGDPPSEESRFRRLHVDHCHKTNAIRGLLCTRCNTALGLFRDNVGFLLTAARYLKRGGILDRNGYIKRP